MQTCKWLIGALALLSTACGGDVNSDSPTHAAGGATNAAGGTTNAAGGTTNAAGGTTNAVGGATNAVGGATNAVGGTTNAVGGTTNAVGGTTNAVGGTTSAAGSAAVSIEVLKVEPIDTTGGGSCWAQWGAFAGGAIRVTLKFSQPVYYETCQFGGISLDGLHNELPACGSSKAYYLNDAYYDNVGYPNLGCDYRTCSLLATKDASYVAILSILELVKTGEKLPPNATASSTLVPVIDVQKKTGPFRLSVGFMTDSKCASQRQTIGVALPSIP